MKIFFLIFGLIPLLFSCATVSNSVQNTQTTFNSSRQMHVSDQRVTAYNIDRTISVGADYLSGKLPIHTKIAFVSMHSPSKNLSEYIIDTMLMHLVNKDIFLVVERSELNILQQEQIYQASGEVSDEEAASIGHQLGVQVIITGAIMETGSRYSLRLKAIDVETAQILGTRIYQVEPDQTLTALLTPLPQTSKTPVKEEQTKEQPKQTVIQGDVNITTNNNTTINGDVYVNTPNWFKKD